MVRYAGEGCLLLKLDGKEYLFVLPKSDGINTFTMQFPKAEFSDFPRFGLTEMRILTALLSGIKRKKHILSPRLTDLSQVIRKPRAVDVLILAVLRMKSRSMEQSFFADVLLPTMSDSF